MTPEASPPQAVDWVFALFRGLHPLRWLLCLGGVFLTGLSLATAQAYFDPDTPPVLVWWQQPVENGTALGVALWATLGRTILAGGLLLAVNGALWSLIGGWIARHELACRQRAGLGDQDGPLEPGPTAFVVRWSRTLVLCYPSALFIVLVGLLILLLAGWVNGWFGGLGSILVALCLPVALLGTAMVLLYGVGGLAWPLMPVAFAAECGDTLEAQARIHSYFLQRPLRFLVLSAVVVGLAALPWAVVYLLSNSLTAGPSQTRQVVFLVAAAFSGSIFWSVETLVYLHLRTALDGVDAGEVATGPRPRVADAGGRRSAGDRRRQLPPAWGAGKGIVQFVVFLVGSWYLISYLLMRVGGGPTSWLDWGLTPWSVPPAQDLGFPYVVARILAGFHGLALIFLLGMTVRRLFRRAASDTEADPATLELFRQLGAGDPGPPDACPRLVECLGHPSFWIRWQAHRHLVRLVPAGKGFGYKAWDPAKKRDTAIAKWRELVPAGPAAESAGTAVDQAGTARE
jgi:hypothetical protein